MINPRGLNFLFAPDFSEVDATTFLRAMGQAFFSLSLGMGSIMCYGSYMPQEENIFKTSMTVAGLDTLIAILAGLAIFPIIFATTFLTIPINYLNNVSWSKAIISLFVNLQAENEMKFSAIEKPVNMSSSKHIGYAIQWFGLCAALIILTIYAYRRKAKRWLS